MSWVTSIPIPGHFPKVETMGIPEIALYARRLNALRATMQSRLPPGFVLSLWHQDLSGHRLLAALSYQWSTHLVTIIPHELPKGDLEPFLAEVIDQAVADAKEALVPELLGS